jgi:DNA mismatch endonuclease, patch repair protein
MRGNRRRDTSPELALRRELHARGLRYRIDVPIRVEGLRPIRPDVVFRRHSLLIFVDGCFWHGCEQHRAAPRANATYWDAKVAVNRDRDKRQTAALAAAGWTVLRFWEHDDPVAAADTIVDVIASGES